MSRLGNRRAERGIGCETARRDRVVNTLTAGPAVVEVAPRRGGRIAQITIGDTPLLVDDHDAAEVAGVAVGEVDPLSWGSFPLVPWAGRIADGRFSFQGSWYEAPGLRLGEHAIHGTGCSPRGTCSTSGATTSSSSAALAGRSAAPPTSTSSSRRDALVCVLSVLAADRAMPVTIGWHPWFRSAGDDRLEFGHDVPPRRPTTSPPASWCDPKPRPWDDCFVEPRPRRSSSSYDGGPTVTISSDCDHWVVFDERPHATCVEPQSGPPDAVNLGRASVLAPGELLQRTMTITWTEPATGATAVHAGAHRTLRIPR